MKRPLSVLVALLVASAAVAVAARGEAEARRKPAKPPQQLWSKYPLGTKKLAPQSRAQPVVRARRSAPAQIPQSSPSSGSSGVNLPLWVVLLSALGFSCLLGLAGESVISRGRRLLRPHGPGAPFVDGD